MHLWMWAWVFSISVAYLVLTTVLKVEAYVTYQSVFTCAPAMLAKHVSFVFLVVCLSMRKTETTAHKQRGWFLGVSIQNIKLQSKRETHCTEYYTCKFSRCYFSSVYFIIHLRTFQFKKISWGWGDNQNSHTAGQDPIPNPSPTCGRYKCCRWWEVPTCDLHVLKPAMGT